jgi:hypothetical protein
VPPPGPAAIIANQVAQVTNPEDIKCIEGVKRELERVGLLYDPSKQEAE